MPLALFDVFRHGIRGAFDLSCYGGVCTQLIVQKDHLLNLFRRNSLRAHKITLLRIGFAGTLHGHVTLALQILIGVGHSLVKALANIFHDVESLITVIEVVYNFWMLIYVRLYEEDGVTCEDAVPEQFLRVKKTMDEYLSQCNHKSVYDSEQESVLVIEDDPTVTAVVEVVDAPVSLDILKYNHHSLKGDLKSKKEILRNMGDTLENREKELLRVDTNLKKTIFHILNTMGIRHMNTQNTTNVAKVGESLEYWYDELYQMMLLAFLRMDNVERMQKYEEELKPLLT